MIDGRDRPHKKDYSSIDHQLFSRLQYISVRRYRSRSGRTFKKEKSVDSDLLADRDRSLSENE